MNPPRPRLLAFTGLAQSGKSTCARHVRERFGYVNFSFATPLKRMLAALTPEADKHATPYVLCGKTIREALQTLGTEWGRSCIGADIWLRAARLEIGGMYGAPGITCDDVRFDNEAELIRSMGGFVVKLTRPGVAKMDHASEAGVSAGLIDAEISAASMGELAGKLDVIISTLGYRQVDAARKAI